METDEMFWIGSHQFDQIRSKHFDQNIFAIKTFADAHAHAQITRIRKGLTEEPGPGRAPVPARVRLVVLLLIGLAEPGTDRGGGGR